MGSQLWGCAELDTTEAMQQQQQQHDLIIFLYDWSGQGCSYLVKQGPEKSEKVNPADILGGKWCREGNSRETGLEVECPWWGPGTARRPVDEAGG